MFAPLFEPITINRLELKNRIAYPGLALLYSYDGRVNTRYENFYLERARGGAALVTVGPVGVDFLGSGLAALSLASDERIPELARLAETIKAQGARAWVQLHHGGAYVFPLFIDGQLPVAPSAVFSRFTGVTPRELSLEEIDGIQEAFARAASRAKAAGFDGVEILGSAGYLITQFLSPLKNRREDAYGGSAENRRRFALELIGRVRTRVGPDFPLTIRMAGDDFVPGSNTHTEMPAIARAYERAGVDAINVTGGWHESRVPQLPPELPRGGYAYLALNVKRHVGVPVLASNRIPDPLTAARIVREGWADMVNLGRVLIADPEWPRKAHAGRADQIRPCVACSQGCMDQIFSGKPLFCAVNPQAGYEGERPIPRTATPRRVMVVGAGVAGLEAALTAARAGHRVEGYEKGGSLGVQVRLAGVPPHKQELFELLRYYRTMLAEQGIPVHLNTAVDIVRVREVSPDAVILATGALPTLPPIAGAHDPGVLSAWKVLEDGLPLSGTVAVIGGGAVGLETALYLASRGTPPPEVLHFLLANQAASVERVRELMFTGPARVSVFEMLPRAGSDVGKSTRWVLLENLRRFGVEILTGTQVQELSPGRVVYARGGEVTSAAFDHVVLATGASPVDALAQELAETGIPLVVAGDCAGPGRLEDAIHGGFLASLSLG